MMFRTPNHIRMLPQSTLSTAHHLGKTEDLGLSPIIMVRKYKLDINAVWTADELNNYLSKTIKKTWSEDFKHYFTKYTIDMIFEFIDSQEDRDFILLKYSDILL